MNGQQPISEKCNRAGLLRLSPAGRQAVRLELRKTSALAGSSRRSGSLPISSLALSCRLRNACWGVLVVLSGCNSAPPANPGDVCSIFTERTSWYRAAKAAEERWQTPIALNMAIIYQESSFRSRARPARERFCGYSPEPGRQVLLVTLRRLNQPGRNISCGLETILLRGPILPTRWTSLPGTTRIPVESAGLRPLMPGRSILLITKVTPASNVVDICGSAG